MTANDKIRVMIKQDGFLIEEKIENSLDALQKVVGGLIDCPYINETFNANNIDLIINDEGKLIDGLPPRAMLTVKNGDIADVIFGNFLFAGHDDEGNTTGLTDDQIEVIKKTVCYHGQYMKTGLELYLVIPLD